jgi:hypothetical protein
MSSLTSIVFSVFARMLPVLRAVEHLEYLIRASISPLLSARALAYLLKFIRVLLTLALYERRLPAEGIHKNGAILN